MIKRSAGAVLYYISVLYGAIYYFKLDLYREDRVLLLPAR